MEGYVKMDLFLPWTPMTRIIRPQRIVHLTRSWPHLHFLHNSLPGSHMLALPSGTRWMDVRCEGLRVARLCSQMGQPNPLWCLEIVYYTPIKRVLIENRLIEFENGAPVMEEVSVRQHE